MRVLVRFVVFLAVFSGAYFAFIRYVDPYGEFESGHFPVVVLDSRRAKLQLFSRFGQRGPVDGLILGSSRSLLFRPEALIGGKGRVFNFAVDNAHAEDFLAIYRYAVAHGPAPRFLIVGLDVPSFQPDDVRDHMFDRSELRRYIDDDAAASTSRSLIPAPVSEVKAAYTKDHLKDAFKAIAMKLRGQNPRTKFGDDGYEQQYSGDRLPAGEIGDRHDFSEDVRSYMERLSGMRRLSPKRLAYLRTLFEEARRNNTTVVVWLTPIHPRLQSLVNASSVYADLLRDINTEAARWTADFGIRYRDYSNLNEFDGLESAWNDPTHMDWRNMDRVADALRREVLHGI